MDPILSTPPLPEPHGAKGARICGVLAIVLALTCIGIPVAIVLGIVALVLQAKAKRLAREQPEAYRMPTQTGLVTGIIGLALPVLMLPFVGIVSALAIPALLGQREKAREKAAQAHLMEGVTSLLHTYDEAGEQSRSEPEIKAALEAQLASLNTSARNPWDPQQPVFATEVQVVFGADAPEDEARRLATRRGQVVFVLQFPREGQQGFLTGTVRLSGPSQTEHILTRVEALDQM